MLFRSPALRRSTRNHKPSKAGADSIVSELAVEDARIAGEDWATDPNTPTANLTTCDEETPELDLSDDNDSDVPIAYATSVPIPEPTNHWLPNSYAEAMTRPNIWQGPIDKELDVMKEREVWKVVNPPPGVRLVRTRWTFANKYNGDGALTTCKARLVAKGFTQIPGVDFYTSYASVVRYESLRMNLAIAAAKDMEAWQVDYVAAYLNAEPQATIYIELPDGAKVEGKVGLLQKSLYGTMDGAANWWETLDKDMKELGYKRSKADPSVRSRHENGSTTITSTYTDDTTGISSSMDEAERAKAELGRKFKTKDLGEASLVLGIKIERDREAGMISISQRAYLERVLERFGMANCNPTSTPIALGTVLSKGQAPVTDDDRQFMTDKPYREVLGSIMYAQVATRPDLSYAVSTLSKFASNPGKQHWIALTRVLRYIKGTLDYKITYGGDGFTDLAPIGYVDADYAGDIDTRRSCAGQVFIQAGGPTSWGSQSQPTVALSTTEAEYMATSRAAKQIEWMYSSMDEVGYPQARPARLYNDNAGAVSLTQNTKGNVRVKHIDIRHHYIRDLVEDGKVIIRHIPSAENLADVFTKPLGRDLHHKACIGLRLCAD